MERTSVIENNLFLVFDDKKMSKNMHFVYFKNVDNYQ